MKREYLYLLILPFLYLLFEYFKFPILTHYYSTNPDPTYIYLMNGLNIADGNWELGHIDNPGTPLHVLTGFFIWITYLFCGQGDMVTDVLLNPEFYIEKSVIFLLSLKAISLLFMGYKIASITKNVFIGLIFQIIPLFIIFRLSCPGLVHPDILLDSLCLLFIAFIFPVLYREDKPVKMAGILKYVTPLAIITGAITATKISAIGMLFVPLLLFSGWRAKGMYILTSVFFFFFFTLPINSKLDDFFQFMMGIATHTGQYGSGDTGLISFNIFAENVYKIFSEEFTLLLTFVLSTAGGLYFTLIRKNKWGYLLLGVAVTYTIQTIIIGKHYSYHYTLPMHYLFVISLFALAEIAKDYGYFIRAANKRRIVSICLMIFITVGIVRAYSHNVFANYGSEQMIPTESFIIKRNQPTLFVPGNENIFLTSGYVQPALWFGKFYAGYITRWDRAGELESLYPDSYFYNAAADNVEDWNRNIPFWIICKMHDKLDIYVRDQSQFDTDHFVRSLIESHAWPDTVLRQIKIYENKDSKEVIYQMSINKEWFIENYIPVYDDKILFDKEQNRELYIPEGAEPLIITTIDVIPGDFITASVWRKSGNKKCFIEFRGYDGFYDHSAYVTDRKGDWEKISISHEMYSGYKGTLDISLRNSTGEPVFCDDFEVSVFQKKTNK